MVTNDVRFLDFWSQKRLLKPSSLASVFKHKVLCPQILYQVRNALFVLERRTLESHSLDLITACDSESTTSQLSIPNWLITTADEMLCLEGCTLPLRAPSSGTCPAIES